MKAVLCVFLSIIPIVIQIGQTRQGLLERATSIGVDLSDSIIIYFDEVWPSSVRLLFEYFFRYIPAFGAYQISNGAS